MISHGSEFGSGGFFRTSPLEIETASSSQSPRKIDSEVSTQIASRRDPPETVQVDPHERVSSPPTLLLSDVAGAAMRDQKPSFKELNLVRHEFLDWPDFARQHVILYPPIKIRAFK